ncbi:hypothetical protein [Pseudomonas knackmussii]|uniref:hypothetical protein n=1 Tax=Pseudomonas knackmussii TaxID=65741 RepID=UPI001363C1B0|nr:hypothetical protein [Pseudomonas knackmussii]
MKSTITSKQARQLQRNKQLARLRLRQAAAPGEPDLEAPEVPDALADGLLTADVLDADLRVNIPFWGRVFPDDHLYVYWDVESPSGVYDLVIDTQTEADFPLPVTIPNTYLLGDGAHQIFYKVIAASGTERLSFATLVLIDKTPPNHGAPPDAPLFPTEVDEGGLTGEYLAANGDQVMVTIPPYAGMEKDQRVTLVWSQDIRLPDVAVTDADVAANKVEIPVSGDTVRQAGEGQQPVFYYLTSRAGFSGPDSLQATVDVLLKPLPANLKAPKVPLAEDAGTLIDTEDLYAGVTIEVDAYDNAQLGDLVVASWGSTSLSPSIVFPSNFPVQVAVPASTIKQEGDTAIDVSYQVIRRTHAVQAPSITVNVNTDSPGPEDPDPVTPENPLLAPPTVQGGSGSINELAPDDRDKPALVTIAVYAEAKAGEVLKLYWGPRPNAILVTTYTVTDADLSLPNFAPFSVETIMVNQTPNDPQWPVFYELSNATDPANPVLSPSQPVNVHMNQPGGPDGLGEAEYVDKNTQGWLIRAVLEEQGGARVLVPPYENMRAGDKVGLDWIAYSTMNAAAGTEIPESAYTALEQTVGDPELANGVSFLVPYDPYINVIAVANPTQLVGAGQVIYHVTQDGATYDSAPAIVPIDLF